MKKMIEKPYVKISNSMLEDIREASKQADSLEKLAVSAAKTADRLKESAAEAEKAKAPAVFAGAGLVQCRGQVNVLLNYMEDIERSFTWLFDIVKLIESIMFRANILTLNAAVEADRAGQYGKRFSTVVADTRDLAAACANVVSETKQLYGESAGKIRSAAKTANDTAETLKTMTEEFGILANLMTNIAGSLSDGASLYEQTSRDMEELSGSLNKRLSKAAKSAAQIQDSAMESGPEPVDNFEDDFTAAPKILFSDNELDKY